MAFGSAQHLVVRCGGRSSIILRKSLKMNKRWPWANRFAVAVVVSALMSLIPVTAGAQGGILGSEWSLLLPQSSIKFQSVKNGTKVETSSFATFSGEMDSEGGVTVRVELDSVDTKVDLRNVRMRFLFFETYRFATATVTTGMDAGVLGALEEQRRLQVPLEFELDLHGVKRTLTAETVLTMFTDDQVAISTSSPINIAAADFNLMDGITKLQDAADVEIVPSGSVSFDLTFKKQLAVVEAKAESVPQDVAAIEVAPEPEVEVKEIATPVALETAGDFSSEECAGRFEILSRTDAITFALNSSELNPSSFDLLDSLTDIVNRCPDMNVVIEGHTDSRGSDAVNMQVSTNRAGSVYQYLLQKGVSDDRIRSVGYGESQPRFPNDTRENRARNRRIEFVAE